MDAEDLAEADEAQNLQTASSFAGLGISESSGQDDLFGLVMNDGETMGVKLLQRMGWRRGQGIGPRVRRLARSDNGDAIVPSQGNEDEHLFAPDDAAIISFVRKKDHRGLGFQDSANDSIRNKTENQLLDSISFDQPTLQDSKLQQKRVQAPAAKKTSFGVGVLNDNGSDDEDPYEMGPRISYNRTIGGAKQTKKASKLKPNSSLANPLVAAKPVFISRKGVSRSTATTTAVCHDGKPPLEGFVLAMQSLDLSDLPKYPAPKVPAGWISKKGVQKSHPVNTTQSTVDVAKSSTLDAHARASILGEAPLPGKSVFSYLSKEARDRIAAVTGRKDLPPGLGEKLPQKQGIPKPNEQPGSLWNHVPFLTKEVASAALSKRGSGWMPYAQDLDKRARYIGFLELRAGTTEALPERAPGMSITEWIRELQEFAHAAQVFKPVSGIMASRFTSAKSQNSDGSPSGQEGDNLLQSAQVKSSDPAVEAAHLGMYGPMTRSFFQFMPSRLLCKRFNVKPPPEVPLDTDRYPPAHSSAAWASFMKTPMDRSGERNPQPSPPQTAAEQQDQGGLVPQKAAVDRETNDALEAKRPGEDIFRAIFGDDDDD